MDVIWIFISSFIFSDKVAEPVKTEMVFVKEECGDVDVKEEQDPLNMGITNINYMHNFYWIYKKI